ncbi:24132_t:CDS:2 [Dentiscutata erythropus]|uniref:Small ribosomal subunit protein mS23 n=1 Tax=Dentiscutata erythropus TaxID=1348616 RepID=A0A9N9F1B7_9GLOM|nr:24132_t:CDS:2 [Dentiscutata erythropus]
MYRGSPTKLHNHVSRLLAGGIYKAPPIWYPVMKAVPPGSSVLRSPLQFQEPTLPQSRCEGRNRVKSFAFKHLRTKVARPQKIVYEEDSLRRRFYRDHPYELLRPQSLIEKEIPVREDWSTLLNTKNPTQINGESVIKYQLYLMSNGMSKSEAYAEACNEFYAIRARQEVAERVAEEQALVFGAKRSLSQTEKAFVFSALKAVIVRLEGHDKPVDVGYSQGTSAQAVLERACKTLGIYDSWNYALYSELFKTWLCDTHLLSSHPEEDTLLVRKKTPGYLELVYNEENPKKRHLPTTLSPNLAAQTKRKGVFGGTKSVKTSLKTRFQAETIYLTTILFTCDNKLLITSGSSKMFPTIEVIRDDKIFSNFEDDSEEFAHVIRTSLDWSTSKETYNDSSSDSDSFHSLHSNSSSVDFSENPSTIPFNQYINDETLWSRSFGYAALKLKSELSLESLGTIYEHVVAMNSSKSKFIVALQYIPNCIKDEIAPDLIKTGALKWKNFDEINNIYQKDFHSIWLNYIEKWCSRQTKLSPGLYLGVLYTESTLQGIKILVPKERKQFIPLGKIRDEAMITAEETSWIKSLTCLSQDCFMDLVMATKGDDDNRTSLGQFQASFINSYHKLQYETGLTWEVNDIYCEQTVDVYLDLRTNQLYTMTNELEENVIDNCGTSLHNDLYLDNNVKPGTKCMIFNRRSSKQQSEILSHDRKHSIKSHPSRGTSGGSHKTFESMISYQEEMNERADDSHNEFMEKDKGMITFDKSNPESEDEEAGSNVKTSTSTGAATSVGEEAMSLSTSLSNTSSIRPFIRIILIVKPMRQIHQISTSFQSRLCTLYPFSLYDALQHATFNTSLYACSRRSMQILQASRAYFAHELLRHLQAMENFSDVNEQNIDDFFFEPDELPKVPEETKKVKQCLDIVRDEISTLRQQWNSASWVMTAIEWDRQRTMKSYNFGGRSLAQNISRKSVLSNRSTSIRSNTGRRESESLSLIKAKGSDTASQIEILRDTMYHAPDRAWNNIRLLGVNIPMSDINNDVVKSKSFSNKQKKQNSKITSKSQKIAAQKPIPPILVSYLSSLPSASKNRTIITSSIVDNQQNKQTQQSKKKTWKSLRLGKRSQQNNSEPELLTTFIQQINVTNKDNNKILNKDTNFKGKEDEKISINISPPTIQPIVTTEPITLITPSFIGSIQDHRDINSEMNHDVNYSEDIDNSKDIDAMIIKSIDADNNIEFTNDERAKEIHELEKEINQLDSLLNNDTNTIDTENNLFNSEEATNVDGTTDHDTFEATDVPSINKETTKSDNNSNKCEPFEEAGDTTEKNITGETIETNVDMTEIDVKNAASDNFDRATEDNVTDDVNVTNSDDAVLDAMDAMIDAIVDVNGNENTKHSKHPTSTDSEKLLSNGPSNDSSNDSSNTLSNSNNVSETTSSTIETPLSSLASSSSTPKPNMSPSSKLTLKDSTLKNSSQQNVPLVSDPTTSYSSPQHVARSIPPTPTTPYFPALTDSTEESVSVFPPETVYVMPEQSTSNLSHRSELEFEPINPFLIPPMSTSTYISPATPLPSTPTTPQYSPLQLESRPTTPLLSKLSLFEELRQAAFQQNSDKRTIFEESNKNKQLFIRTPSSPPSSQDQASLTPRDSPPISPSTLPPPSLLSPAFATSSTTLSAHTSYSQSSTSIHSKARTPTPSLILPSSQTLLTIPRSPTLSPTSSTSSYVPSNSSRPSSLRSSSSSSSLRTPAPLLPSARPPPIPFPSEWPKLKKTVRPEPKKVEADAGEFFKKKSHTLNQYTKLISEDRKNDNNKLKDGKIGEKLIDNDCASLNGDSISNKDTIISANNDIGVMNN